MLSYSKVKLSYSKVKLSYSKVIDDPTSYSKFRELLNIYLATL